MPALLTLAGILVVAQAPPHDVFGIAGLVVAALLGAAVGWQRGRLTRISLDPETGVLHSQASPAAVLIIVALFAARYGLRAWLGQSQKGDTVALATDALLLFSAALILVTRLEMWLRCRRLIAAGAGRP
jgi:apolipoprotein N-acyltransferase